MNESYETKFRTIDLFPLLKFPSKKKQNNCSTWKRTSIINSFISGNALQWTIGHKGVGLVFDYLLPSVVGNLQHYSQGISRCKMFQKIEQG